MKSKNKLPPKYPDGMTAYTGNPRDGEMPPPPKGKLPPDSPMRLINEIVRIMQSTVEAEAQSNLMNQKSCRELLIALAMRDGVTQLDLVKFTHLKAPTVSVTLQKMEREGYVLRKPDNYDLRATRVYLTEKGREFDNAMCEKILREEKQIMTDIDENDISVTISVLHKMKANILNGGIRGEAVDKP